MHFRSLEKEKPNVVQENPRGLEKENGVQEPGTRDVRLLKESAARKDSSAMLLQHPFLEKFNILLHGRREIFEGLGPPFCRICSQIWICGREVINS